MQAALERLAEQNANQYHAAEAQRVSQSAASHCRLLGFQDQWVRYFFQRFGSVFRAYGFLGSPEKKKNTL